MSIAETIHKHAIVMQKCTSFIMMEPEQSIFDIPL